MTAIFISYSRKDSAFATRLAADLQQAGHTVWQDLTNLRGGQDWIAAIDQAIKGCDTLVLVLSPGGIASPWVLDEVARARNLGKPIIPVLLKPVADLPFHLTRIQQIDFQGDRKQALAQLLDALGAPSALSSGASSINTAKPTVRIRRTTAFVSVVVILIVLVTIPYGELIARLRGLGGNGLLMNAKPTIAVALTTPTLVTPTTVALPTSIASATTTAQLTSTSAGPALDPATPASRPTSTATRVPTPTVPSFSYHTLALQAIANESLQEGYKSPPSGKVELAGVPFDLPSGLNSATTQAEGRPTFPTKLRLDNLNMPKTKKVFLLITGGSTRKEFAGKVIGELILSFANQQVLRIPLIPGQNLREWKDCCNPNVTQTTDPTVQQVWSGQNNFDSGTAVIDMLTAQIPEIAQQETLQTIEILDSSVQAVGSKNPAINLLGVTVLSQN